MKPLLGAAIGGALVALSLPPFGLWFLAFAGYAALAFALTHGEETSRRARVGRAAAFNLTYFCIGLAWCVEFQVIAFVALLLAQVAITTVPYALTPKAPRVALLMLPALVTFGELVRYRWPLGGMPLAGVALGQVSGPLLPVSRIGGDHAIVFVTALLGMGLFAARGNKAIALVAAVVTVGVGGAGWAIGAPEAGDPIRVAYVQGGGVRGLRAVENTVTDVYGNQVEAQEKLKGDVDLIVWPEDVIDLAGPIADDPVRDEIGALATEAGATLVAGVIEDDGIDRFRNAAVAWDRSGNIVDRYEKVHRVPFGEYVPARDLVSKLADISAVPRDAIAGKGDGVLLTRAGQLGVLISYETFFADRARAAVGGGAEILLVPTNASSFRGRQVPEQEVAAARLRAVESGRDLIQAAPTGHSVFITAEGKPTKLSKLGASAAASETLHKRDGTTPYQRAGDRPIVAIVLLLLVAGLSLDRSVKSNL